MNKIADDTKLSHVYQLLYSQIEGGHSKSGSKLPTEQELAARFGYSRATVARAMQMLVREGLVERRKRAGSFVRGRRSIKTPLFGAMIGRTMPVQRSDNVFVAVSHEIAHQAELHEHALVVHDPGFRVTSKAQVAERVSQIAAQLIERNVAGVFVLPDPIDEGEEQSLTTKAVTEFDAARIPVVLLDRDIYRYPRRSKYDLVGIDNKRAAYILTQHLISLGCRKIVFVAPESYASAAEERIAGYLQALWANGLQPERSRVVYLQHSARDAAESTLRRDMIEDMVRTADADAFVIVNDEMAAQVMQVALAMGKRIPDDIRLVGFDDLPQSRYLAVPLTTVRQPCEELGFIAVQTMLERIRDPERHGVDVTVRSELIIRQSCGANRAPAAPATDAPSSGNA